MKEVLNFLKNLSINDNEYIVVACSGGPDSMFLLNLLKSLNYKIICAHVNHKARKESDQEYQFLEEYCKKEDIIFEGIELTGYVNGNFEKYARDFRYSFFETLLKKYESSILMTAHHGDDLVETIMMRLVRGSSLKGYAGFLSESKKKNYRIIRPLVYLTKDYILQYNKEHNIPYVLDDSNNSLDYTRNRIRHKVLPVLKDEDNLIHEKLLSFSEELNDAYSFILGYTKNSLKKVFVDNVLDINKFSKEDEYLQRQILNYILSMLYPDNLYLVNSNHVTEIFKLIKSPKPNLQLMLPGNILIVKRYDKLSFKENEVIKEDYKYELKDGLVINDYEFIYSKSLSKSNYVIRLNSKDIALPLYVRTRIAGDKMQVKNMKGNKKVNDIFIDSKIEKAQRDSWPIVVDSNDTIIWLPGLKKSDFDIPINEEYDIIVEYRKKGEKDYE